jgi:hypothetical protein
MRYRKKQQSTRPEQLLGVYDGKLAKRIKKAKKMQDCI